MWGCVDVMGGCGCDGGVDVMGGGGVSAARLQSQTSSDPRFTS